MTPKIRDARCPVCGALVRQRKDGSVRIHRSKQERCIVINGALVSLGMCLGSGMPVKEVERG
jgi:hypothetical protein